MTNHSRPGRDAGVVTPIEMMYLLVFAVVATALLGFLGRLHAAGVQVGTVAQAAARSASLAPTSAAGIAAALTAVGSSTLSSQCRDRPTTTVGWSPSSNGTWHGGTVSVRVSCVIDNSTLAGWWAPGSRTIQVSDTQPIDRYQR